MKMIIQSLPLLSIVMLFTSCLDNSEAVPKDCQAGMDKERRLGFRRGYHDGRVAGYEEGYREGEIQGYQNGNANGLENGLEKGRSDGYKNGYKDGHDDAYALGQKKGYAKGKAAVYAALKKFDLILKTGTVILLWMAIFTVCYLAINRKARGLL